MCQNKFSIKPRKLLIMWKNVSSQVAIIFRFESDYSRKQDNFSRSITLQNWAKIKESEVTFDGELKISLIYGDYEENHFLKYLEMLNGFKNIVLLLTVRRTNLRLFQLWLVHYQQGVKSHMAGFLASIWSDQRICLSSLQTSVTGVSTLNMNFSYVNKNQWLRVVHKASHTIL